MDDIEEGEKLIERGDMSSEKPTIVGGVVFYPAEKKPNAGPAWFVFDTSNFSESQLITFEKAPP